MRKSRRSDDGNNGSGDRQLGSQRPDILIPRADRNGRLARQVGRIAQDVDPAIAAEALRLAAEKAAAEEKDKQVVRKYLPAAIVELADFREGEKLTTLVSVVDDPAIKPLLEGLYKAAGITSDGFESVEGRVIIPSDTARELGFSGDALDATTFWRSMPDGGIFQQLHFELTKPTPVGDIVSAQVLVLASPNNLNITPYE